MKYLLQVSFFLILALTSCNENNNQYYVNQIHSIELQIDSATYSYPDIDTFPIAEIRKSIKTNCNRLSDPNNSNISGTFIPYSQIEKSMKQIIKMDNRIKKELKLSKEQISNLLYDAENGLIDTVLLSQYINEEKRIVYVVMDRMKYNTERIKVELARYDSLNPIINQYLIEHN